MASPQFNPPPPKQEERQFNPPPPKEEQDVSIEEQETSIEEEEDFDEERIPVFPDEIDENGDYIIDDLRLTEEQFKANYGTEEERQAIPYDSYRWTGGVVPYKLENNVSKKNKKKINAALKVLNAALTNCLVFRLKHNTHRYTFE